MAPSSSQCQLTSVHHELIDSCLHSKLARSENEYLCASEYLSIWVYRCIWASVCGCAPLKFGVSQLAGSWRPDFRRGEWIARWCGDHTHCKCWLPTWLTLFDKLIKTYFCLRYIFCRFRVHWHWVALIESEQRNEWALEFVISVSHYRSWSITISASATLGQIPHFPEQQRLEAAINALAFKIARQTRHEIA